MATLLIIGGTGFFGKSILDAYKRGLLTPWNIDKVIAMSRNAEALHSNAPELIIKGVELFNGDIATMDYIPEADYVIHAAASTDASRYLSQGVKEKKNIILGALNYSKLAVRFHKKSKIVFCSSGAVYGYQPESVERLEENMGLGEIESLSDTKKSYAYAKRDSENAIKSLGDLGLDVSIARCFSFIGKYLPKDKHFAIGNFIADGLAGRAIQVKADKKVYRSYMYADDLVEWLLTIAQASTEKCPIYNVGSDQIIEIHEMARVFSNKFNVLTSEVKLSSNIPDRYIPSTNKAKSELNLTLKYDLLSSIDLSC